MSTDVERLDAVGDPELRETLGVARGSAAPVTVKLGEFYFAPRVVTVHVGQPVRFVNVGKIDHTVSAPGTIRPRPLGHGDVQTVRFAKPGLVRYVCTFHPTLMRGTIRVVR